MLPLLLNKIIQTDKLLFLHLNSVFTFGYSEKQNLHLSQPRILSHSFRKQIFI